VPLKKDRDYIAGRQSSNDPAVANTILNQLGGNRFLAMTGAKSLIYDDNSLRFRIGRNKSKSNLVKIILTSQDLYDVEFGRAHGIKYKVLDTVRGVGAENLTDVFTNYTGLFTSL
jgi:hypothetical protein